MLMTCTVMRFSVPVIVGVDWFMATCRSLTNMIGNSVACVVVARWEKLITAEQVRNALRINAAGRGAEVAEKVCA